MPATKPSAPALGKAKKLMKPEPVGKTSTIRTLPRSVASAGAAVGATSVTKATGSTSSSNASSKPENRFAMHSSKQGKDNAIPSSTSSTNNSVSFGGEEEVEYEYSVPTSMKEIRASTATAATTATTHGGGVTASIDGGSPCASAYDLLNAGTTNGSLLGSGMLLRHSAPEGTSEGTRAAAPVSSAAVKEAKNTEAAAKFGKTGAEDKQGDYTNLFIRGIPLTVEQETLDTHFAPFGNILSSAIMRNIHTGESLGTAFVRFERHDDAQAAMDELHGTKLEGRVISVQWAKKQEGAPVGEARRKIMKLFIRNIPQCISVEELAALFAPFGKISQVSIHKDTAAAAATVANAPGAKANKHGEADAKVGKGISLDAANTARNIAFVNYAEEGAAEAAANAIHNTKPYEACNGIPLMVKLAEEAPTRPLNHPNGANANNSHGNNVNKNALKLEAAANSNDNSYTNVSRQGSRGGSDEHHGSGYDGFFARNSSGNTLTMPLATFPPQQQQQQQPFLANEAGAAEHHFDNHLYGPMPGNMGMVSTNVVEGGPVMSSRPLVHNPAAYSYNAFPNNFAVYQQQQQQMPLVAAAAAGAALAAPLVRPPVLSPARQGSGMLGSNAGQLTPQSSLMSIHNPGMQNHNKNSSMMARNTGGNGTNGDAGVQDTRSPFASPSSNTSVLLGRSAPPAPPGSRAFNAPPPQLLYHQHSLPMRQSQNFMSHTSFMNDNGSGNSAAFDGVTAPPDASDLRRDPLVPAPASQQQQQQQQMRNQQVPVDGYGSHMPNNHNDSPADYRPPSPSAPVTPQIYSSNGTALTTFNHRASCPQEGAAAPVAPSNTVTPAQTGAAALESRPSFSVPAPRSFRINAESSFVLRHMQQQQQQQQSAGRANVSNSKPQTQPPRERMRDSRTASQPAPMQPTSSFYGEGPTQETLYGSEQSPYTGGSGTAASTAASPEVNQRAVVSSSSLILRARTAQIASSAAVRQSSGSVRVNPTAANAAGGPSLLGSRLGSGLNSNGGSGNNLRVYRHNPYAPLTTTPLTTGMPSTEEA